MILSEVEKTLKENQFKNINCKQIIILSDDDYYDVNGSDINILSELKEKYQAFIINSKQALDMFKLKIKKEIRKDEILITFIIDELLKNYYKNHDTKKMFRNYGGIM